MNIGESLRHISIAQIGEIDWLIDVERQLKEHFSLMTIYDET